jgi:ParB-like nuclease domain
LRKFRPAAVEALAESIKAQGQLQPILVQRCGADFVLITGRHRLQAVRKLGHDTIRAEIADNLDADQALLIEIDENLVRADLSPAERALHISKRKELYERLHPETKHGAVGRGGKSSQNEISFVDDVAEKTGTGRSTVARDVTRANKVVVLDEIVGTTLDEGAELDAMAKLSEPEQRELAKRAKAGEKVSAKPARAKPVGAASTVSTASLAAQPAATDGAAPAPAAETPASSRDVGPYSGAEHDRLRARNDALNGENRALQIKIGGLESEIAELKERNAELEARVAELNGEAPAPISDDLSIPQFMRRSTS